MFAKPSDYAGASFFKPADHMSDLALLIEPKSVDRDVSSEYQGNVRLRDEVVCDISVFANQSALENGEPTTIIKSTKVVHGMLTSTVSKIIGGAMVATLNMAQTQKGSGFVFRDADVETEEAVGVYFTARSEATEAAPTFED